jgi:hypothetical protein
MDEMFMREPMRVSQQTANADQQTALAVGKRR